MDVHDWRYQNMSYAKAVQVVDDALGRLLAALEAQGLLTDAVVVVTSDHGERLGEAHGIPGEMPNSIGHYGNPSWEEELRVPLVVAPPVLADTKRLVRSQDFYRLVLEIAGLASGPAADTKADELFVGELHYRTYREGRFKTAVRRSDGRAFLYDLEADPDEQRNLAQSHALRVLTHRNRLDELTRELAAAPVPRRELSEEEKGRLRALGYLQEQ